MQSERIEMDATQKEKPLLSIITICFNRVSDIAQTCESVVNQTWQGFEWFVIDGASTDGTIKVLEKYHSRCTRLISEPDCGVYHAMNKGLALAKGEYVLFLNGGDRLSGDDILEKSFAAITHDADIMYGDIFLERDGEIVDKTSAPSGKDVDFLFFASGVIPHPASFIRRKLFVEHGGYDESYRIVGDLDRWVVFAKSGCTFRKLEAVVSVFKLGGISDDKQPTNHMRLAELDRVEKTYYTAEEVAESRKMRKAREGYAVAWSFLPLGAEVHLFSREETKCGIKKVKWCVLGLPVLKKRSTSSLSAKNKYRLLGILPLPL